MTASPLAIEHVQWSKVAAERAGTPLVVALHGRGADESSMIGLAQFLPPSVTIAAPRGPLAVDGGWTWFANRGIGRPIAESIKASADALFTWLEGIAGAHTSVHVLGFSGGTAMAGGLLFSQPQRFSSAVLLSGTLPWDADLNTSSGRFAGLPLFWGFDGADPVIPRDLVDRSEAWLRAESGAALEEHDYPGMGHGISTQELDDVRAFLTATIAQ